MNLGWLTFPSVTNGDQLKVTGHNTKLGHLFHVQCVKNVQKSKT